MRVGIATDHGGFGLKEELVAQLRSAGHEVVDFGAHRLSDCRRLSRLCHPPRAGGGRGQGGARRGDLRQRCRRIGVRQQSAGRPRRPDPRSLLGQQGVEDDHMNVLCMGGRTVGPAVAWDLVQTFLTAEFSQAERHLRRLGKVASLEAGKS